MTEAATEDTPALTEDIESFELPDRPPPTSPLSFGPSMGQQPTFGPAPAHSAPRRGDVKTLEDLYDQYPKLGEGDWKIRVERTYPRQFRGCSTHGYLGDLFERLSLEEFRDRWGGGTYKLTVMRPVGNGDTVTRADYRSAIEITIKLPGDPSLEGINSNSNNGSGDDDMMAQRYMHPGTAPQVEIERIRADTRERDRLHAQMLEERRRSEERVEQERREAQRIPERQYDVVMQTTRHALDDVKDFSASRDQYWQTEVERLRAELNLANQERHNLERELQAARSDAANTTRQIETAALREQKERFDERIADMRDRYEEERRRKDEESSRRISEMATEHRRIVEDMTARHTEERRNYESQQLLERERAREESRSRIEQVERAKETEIANMSRLHEQRISELQRGKESELAAIREQTRREVDTVRMAEQSSATLVRETSISRVALLESEVNRLASELSRKHSEVDDLRDRLTTTILGQVKDPLSELQRAKDMATQFGGLVDAAEARAEGEPTWAQTGMKVVQQFAENLPDMVNKITEVRQQQQQQQQQQRVVVAPQHRPPAPGARPLPQGPQRYQPPPMQQAPMQQQPMSPVAPVYNAPQGNYTPPPMGAAAYAPDIPTPMSTAVYQVPSPIQPHGEPATSGPSPMGYSGDESVEDGGSGDGDGEVSVGPVTIAVDGPPPGLPQRPLGVENAKIIEFMQNLETRIRENVVSSRLFARGFVERVGPQNAAMLLQGTTPEMIFELAQGASSDSRIVTREGQKYVREMFAEVARIVAGGGG